MLAMGEHRRNGRARPSFGDFAQGPRTLGWEYAELLTQPEDGRADQARHRRGPPLSRPARPDVRLRDASRAHCAEAFTPRRAGRGRSHDRCARPRAPQFLGMIANAVFWPQLVHPTWSIDEEETSRAVEEAVRTIVARYGTEVAGSTSPRGS